MLIIFRTRALADAWLQEIAVVPSYCWVWMGPKKTEGDAFEVNIGDPDGSTNVITYVEDTNGLTAICHPFTEDDILFFTTYMEEIITSGDVRLIADDVFPVDWIFKTEIV